MNFNRRLPIHNFARRFTVRQSRNEPAPYPPLRPTWSREDGVLAVSSIPEDNPFDAASILASLSQPHLLHGKEP